MNNGLAAGDKCRRFSTVRMASCHRAQEAPGLPRLAAKAVCQNQRFIAQRPAGVCRGSTQFTHTVRNMDGTNACSTEGANSDALNTWPRTKSDVSQTLTFVEALVTQFLLG